MVVCAAKTVSQIVCLDDRHVRNMCVVGEVVDAVAAAARPFGDRHAFACLAGLAVVQVVVRHPLSQFLDPPNSERGFAPKTCERDGIKREG